MCAYILHKPIKAHTIRFAPFSPEPVAVDQTSAGECVRASRHSVYRGLSYHTHHRQREATDQSDYRPCKTTDVGKNMHSENLRGERLKFCGLAAYEHFLRNKYLWVRIFL